MVVEEVTSKERGLVSGLASVLVSGLASVLVSGLASVLVSALASECQTYCMEDDCAPLTLRPVRGGHLQ
eukprot:2398884-Prymnesium_polylepis.1